MLPELGIVELELGEEDIILDLDSIVPLSDDLTTEFSEQPALYAYVAMLAARAESTWLASKRLLDEEHARTDKEVRRDLMMDGDKVTEGRVNAEIKMRKGYLEAVDDELWFRQQYLIMRAIERSLDMRAQMLISLGAHLRAEAQQTGMLIRDTKKELEKLTKGKKRRRRKPPVNDNVEDENEYVPPF